MGFLFFASWSIAGHTVLLSIASCRHYSRTQSVSHVHSYISYSGMSLWVWEIESELLNMFWTHYNAGYWLLVVSTSSWYFSVVYWNCPIHGYISSLLSIFFIFPPITVCSWISWQFFLFSFFLSTRNFCTAKEFLCSLCRYGNYTDKHGNNTKVCQISYSDLRLYLSSFSWVVEMHIVMTHNCWISANLKRKD